MLVYKKTSTLLLKDELFLSFVSKVCTSQTNIISMPSAPICISG